MNDQTNKKFLEYLISGNRNACSELINHELSNELPVTDLYENIIKESLYKIGELWEFNKISVATEHLASAIVEAILNEIYQKIITGVKNNNSVVVACVENEFHQIGIKMVSDIFDIHEWNTYFLGSNTPTNELIAFIKIIKPDVLALSLSIYFNLPILETMLEKIKVEFPDINILIGGQAFRKGGHEVIKKYKNILYLPNLKSIESFITNF